MAEAIAARHDDETARYRVTGMDCAPRAVPGVEEVKVSIASQVMTLRADDPRWRLPEVECVVRI